MSNPHWQVIGIGSIGGLFVARLAAAGLAPVAVLRDDDALLAWHAAAGITVVQADGSRLQVQPDAVTVATAHRQPPRCLLAATKAPDTLAAIAPLLAGDGDGQLLVLLQNGMGVSERVRAHWPRLRLWNAVTTAGAWRESAFLLHCVATGETLAGPWDDRGDTALDADMGSLFATAIIAPAADIRAVLWRKLAVNAVINAPTALYRCRNGELADNADARALLATLAGEVECVARAEGIRFGEPVLQIAERIMQQTARNHSSMNRDVAAGRQTEIDYINGYVVARAAGHGIAVPANRAMVEAIHALATGNA